MANGLIEDNKLKEITAKVSQLFKEFKKEYNSSLDSLDLLFKICERENIKIIQEKLGDFKGVSVSGFIKYPEKEGDSAKIVLNKSLHPNRKLFTLAHELGHYFLHRNQGNMLDTRLDIESASNKKEAEANEFAGQILIPQYKLKDILGKNKYVSSEEVSKLSYIFKVSEGCMKARLRNLEYIPV